MTKRFGFTLAEVLITLGIIGVVAAMTIPTLIANTNGAKFRSQFKKTLSTLNQAGLMAQAQYDFDYAGVNNDSTCTGTQNPNNNDMTFCSILNGTLTGHTYLGPVGTENTPIADYSMQRNTTLGTLTDYTVYSLADGSLVGFKTSNTKNCTLPIGAQLSSDDTDGNALLTGACLGFIDVNGVTLPNSEVACSAGDDGSAVQTELKPQTPCKVVNNASDMTDVFPIVFHDATVEPASNAAKYVLTSSK